MKLWHSFAITIAISGCATLDPPPPVVSTRTVEVRVPVSVPCFTEAERPVLLPRCEVPEGATVDQLAACVVIDKMALEQYARAVDALFIRCMKGGQ